MPHHQDQTSPTNPSPWFNRTGWLGVKHQLTYPPPPIPLHATPPPSAPHPLSLITTRTQYRGGSFLPRTNRDWNSPSIDAAEATTVDIFLCHVPPTDQSNSFLFLRENELEAVQQFNFKDLWPELICGLANTTWSARTWSSSTWLWASKERGSVTHACNTSWVSFQCRPNLTSF